MCVLSFVYGLALLIVTSFLIIQYFYGCTIIPSGFKPLLMSNVIVETFAEIEYVRT